MRLQKTAKSKATMEVSRVVVPVRGINGGNLEEGGRE